MVVEGLNGVLSIGDKVAIAVGAGNYGGGMRIGEVLEFVENYRYSRYARADIAVKVRVTMGPSSFSGYPYIKTFPYPRRIVKLNQE